MVKCIQQKSTRPHISLCLSEHAFVTNPRSGQTIVVRVNDRGPFIGAREFDLSRRAAADVGLIGPGVATLQFEIL